MDHRTGACLADISLPSEDATTAFAARLAPGLKAGDAILLSGDIGAGKSFLARQMIQTRMAAVGVVEDVPSPTFTLVQTYHVGGAEIWHADLFRLGDESEVEELGLTEAFSTAICLVEWPDRLGTLTPPDALSLEMVVTGDTARRASLSWADPKWQDRLKSVLAQ